MNRVCIITRALYPTESMSPEALRSWDIARTAAAAGDEVMILHVSSAANRRESLAAARSIHREFKIEVTGLGGLQPLLGSDERLEHSMSCLALAALKKLHAGKALTRVHVPVGGGFGLRIAQALRANSEFDGIDFVFHFDSCGEWSRFEHRKLGLSRTDVKTDFCERETLALAPRAITPSRHLRAFVAGIGWDVGGIEVSVAHQISLPGEGANARAEIPCFLGDAANSPGFNDFLQVIGMPSAIARSMAVCESNAGAERMRESVKVAVAKGGGQTTMSIPPRWDRLPKVLRERNAVVILPDGIAGSRVTWLAGEGIPFVFPSTLPEDLPALRAFPALAFELAKPQTLLAAIRAATDVVNWESVFRAALDARPAESARAPAAPTISSSARPQVLIAVSHYNLGALVEETLEAIVDQDYPSKEVLVVDDGSSDPDAVAVFRKLAKKFPDFQFVERAHEGYWSPRNFAIRECQAPFLIVVDGDNLPVPHMTSAFVEAMRRNPDYAACSSFISAFEETREAARAGRFTATHTPLGGDIVSGFFENVFGDTNSIFRIEAIRDIGGFRENFQCTFGDWEIFQRLVARGHRLGVVPEVLLHYRRRRGGMIQTSPLFANYAEILKVMEVPAGLPFVDRRRFAHALHGLSLSSS